MNKIKIGVVGLGFGHHHVTTLANMPQAELVAVADLDADKLQRYAAQYGMRTYQDAIEMMQTETLDAISICTSPKWREPIIRHAAENDIALFVEKPWASDPDHAAHLASLCQPHQATVMVGFSFRYLPAIQKLKNLLADGLGAPRIANAEYIFDWLPDADNWLWNPANGNGFFNENSCHLLDALCYLMGNPVSVFAEGGNFHGSPSEEVASVVIRFANGASASLMIGCLGVGTFTDYPRLNLISANGQAHLHGSDHMWQSLTWAKRGDDHLRRLETIPEQLAVTRYHAALAHFIDCVQHGNTPSATIEDGILAVRLASAIYESIRTGQKVSL